MKIVLLIEMIHVRGEQFFMNVSLAVRSYSALFVSHRTAASRRK